MPTNNMIKTGDSFVTNRTIGVIYFHTWCHAQCSQITQHEIFSIWSLMCTKYAVSDYTDDHKMIAKYFKTRSLCSLFLYAEHMNVHTTYYLKYGRIQMRMKFFRKHITIFSH
jgi:hypothetical protein